MKEGEKGDLKSLGSKKKEDSDKKKVYSEMRKLKEGETRTETESDKEARQ